jgi:meiotically up-regulated gene 157 (Mug157) protein
MNKDNQLVDSGKHYAFIGGATIFIIGYVWDIVMPVMSVSSQNDKENEKTALKPMFFTNGETTVMGFSFNF